MDIENLKESISLYQYIDNAGHKLKRIGANEYRVDPCPVCGHKDHFTIYPDTNSYFSFSGCCNGGSIIDYLIEVESMDQAQAIERIKQLADNTGGFTLEAIPEKEQRQARAVMNKEAAQRTEAHKKTLSMLKEKALKGNTCKYYYTRGLTDKTIEAYNLGYISKGHKIGPDFKGKYLLPVSDTFCILRSEDEKEKYRNIGSPDLFNVRYLQDPALTGQEVFITEGIFDALSLEELDRPAVALNSTANKGKLLAALQANRDSLKDKLFIIALDTDTEGTQAAEAIASGAQGLGLRTVIFNLEGYKDINEALTADREALARQLDEGLQEQLEASKLQGTVYEYLLEDFELDQIKRIEEPDIKTGINSLDKALGSGLYPGLYIVGAISSLGKTALALQLADNIAAGKQQVLFFSLEMGRYEMTCRSLTREYFKGLTEDLDMNGALELARKDSTISTGYVIRPGYNNTDIYSRPEFKKALEGYKRGPAKYLSLVEGDFNLTIDKMEAVIESSIARTGSRPVVFIDYLQVIQPAADSRLSDKQHIDQVVVRLKQLSRRLDLPVVAVSSFNRASYSDEGGPSMAAFKESGSIEYSADVLLYMQLRRGKDDDINEVKNKQPRPINLVILKNRRGLAFEEVKLDYYTKQNYFTENLH